MPPMDTDPRTTSDSEHQLGEDVLSSISTKLLTGSNPIDMITRS